MIDAYASITTTSTCERNTPDKTNSVQMDNATCERKDRSILPRIQQVACMIALGDTGQKEKKRACERTKSGKEPSILALQVAAAQCKGRNQACERKRKSISIRGGARQHPCHISIYPIATWCQPNLCRCSESRPSLPGRRAHGTQQLGL